MDKTLYKKYSGLIGIDNLNSVSKCIKRRMPTKHGLTRLCFWFYAKEYTNKFMGGSKNVYNRK